MNAKKVWQLVFFLVLFTLVVSGCKPSNYEESACQSDSVLAAISTGVNIECGYLTVPENRSREDSPMIRLHVAIVHTRSSKPASDPIVILQGGPGASALEGIFGWLGMFERFRTDRDLILLDQRGTGSSQPSLDCPEVNNPNYQNWTQNLNWQESIQNGMEALKTCHDRLVAEGVDLSAYASAANAADVEDLRKALGYSKWNIYGSSYGTRLALTVMRDYPKGIRSVILDAVYPPQADLPSSGPESFERSLNLLFEHCAIDPGCNQSYPELKTTYYEVVDQLDSNPLTFNYPNTSMGESYNVIFNGDRFIWSTYQLLYNTDQIPGLPRWIYAIKDGNTGSFPELLETLIFADYINEGMYQSTQCNDEAPFGSIESLKSAYVNLSPRLLRITDDSLFYKNCDMWVESHTSPIENEAVVSDIPTLVLSGEFDPITPPAWGRMVAETLSRSQFFEFPGVGHVVIGSSSCVSQMIFSFIDNPNVSVDASCINLLGLEFKLK